MRTARLRPWLVLGWAVSIAALPSPATAQVTDPISIVITLPADIYLGQRVEAVIDVVNVGDEPLTGITIDARTDLCGPMEGPEIDVDGDGILVPEETWRYRCVLGWFGGDHLQVEVTGVTSGGMPVAGRSSVEYERLDPVRLDFVASAPSVEEGEAIEWTVGITNVGPIRLTAVRARSRVLWPDWPGPIPYRTPIGPFEAADNGDDVLDPGEVWSYRHTELVRFDGSFLEFELGFTPDGSPGTHLALLSESDPVTVVAGSGDGGPSPTLPFTGSGTLPAIPIVLLAVALASSGSAIARSARRPRDG
jgi:hypothetical protein